MQVPDDLADWIEAASERDKIVCAYRLASLMRKETHPRDLRAVFKDNEAWQAEHGVSGAEFDRVFAELAAED